MRNKRAETESSGELRRSGASSQGLSGAPRLRAPGCGRLNGRLKALSLAFQSGNAEPPGIASGLVWTLTMAKTSLIAESSQV